VREKIGKEHAIRN